MRLRRISNTARHTSACWATRSARKDAILGLKSAVGYIRRELAQRVNLRNTPEITFVLDQSIEYGVNMSRLIDEVTARDSQE